MYIYMLFCRRAKEMCRVGFGREQRDPNPKDDALIRKETPTCKRRVASAYLHRWNRNPRPQPQTFGKLASLI